MLLDDRILPQTSHHVIVREDARVHKVASGVEASALELVVEERAFPVRRRKPLRLGYTRTIFRAREGGTVSRLIAGVGLAPDGR